MRHNRVDARSEIESSSQWWTFAWMLLCVHFIISRIKKLWQWSRIQQTGVERLVSAYVAALYRFSFFSIFLFCLHTHKHRCWRMKVTGLVLCLFSPVYSLFYNNILSLSLSLASTFLLFSVHFFLFRICFHVVLVPYPSKNIIDVSLIPLQNIFLDVENLRLYILWDSIIVALWFIKTKISQIKLR